MKLLEFSGRSLPDGFEIVVGPYEVGVCGIYYRTERHRCGHSEITPVASKVIFRDTRNGRAESFDVLNLENVARGTVDSEYVAFRLKLSQGAKYGIGTSPDFLTLNEASMRSVLRCIKKESRPYYDYAEAQNRQARIETLTRVMSELSVCPCKK